MTTESTLLKSRSVMEITHEGISHIYFAHPDRNEEPENQTSACLRHVNLDRETWEDMGCPREITISIEPGDRLDDVKDENDG